MIEHLGIHPVIDQEFEMRNLGAALEYLSAARHVGKVVVRV
jgi:NADPH:quinone reductase-like Zn-dependent oxidoreductase